MSRRKSGLQARPASPASPPSPASCPAHFLFLLARLSVSASVSSTATHSSAFWLPSYATRGRTAAAERILAPPAACLKLLQGSTPRPPTPSSRLLCLGWRVLPALLPRDGARLDDHAGGRSRRGTRARILVDGPGRRVLLAEAGEDAAAFLASLLSQPVRAAVDALLREDPASAAAGCFSNLAAAEALLPRVAAASSTATTSSSSSSSSSSHAPPAGMGVMARRLYRCAHLGCRCSDVASREAGSACPCDSPSCAADATTRGSGRRDTELHFLEACFYRRPDRSAATAGGRRGAGRSGDTFYRCRARDERRAGAGAGRDVFPCRFRVTDERGVECPLCGGRTTVEVKCAAKAGDGEGSSAIFARPAAGSGVEDEASTTTTTTTYAVLDDLTVRPVTAGLSGAALLSSLGVAADADGVREVTVPFGYKEGLSLIWAAVNSKTALTDVFLTAVAPAARRRSRR